MNARIGWKLAIVIAPSQRLESAACFFVRDGNMRACRLSACS
jgi:hypothetical protein